MSNLGSDLEEGEILDDSPPSPSISKKGKELPQRYVVRSDKNNFYKHKKDCKHSIHYHAKKLYKLNKTPSRLKDTHKKYHKPSCSREKSHKVPNRHSNSDFSKHLLFENGDSFSQTSLISEMKGSVKSSYMKNQNTKPNKCNSKKSHSGKQNIQMSNKNFGMPEISSVKISENNFDVSVADKKCENSDLQSENPDSEQFKQLSTKSCDDISDIIKLTSNNNVKKENTSSCSLNAKNEESEDEEELRRIALATCAKRNAVVNFSENVSQLIENSDTPKTESLHISGAEIMYYETSNQVSDNYEVVDMEVDEDVQDSMEVAQPSIIINQNIENSNNLFVIDTNPSQDLQGNKENSFSKPQIDNSSDEEFEVDVMRAELINSMYRKKICREEQVQKLNLNVVQKQVPVITDKKRIVNYHKQSLNFRQKRLRTAKHTLRKNSIGKLGNLNCSISKTSLPVQSYKPPERLVIALNDDSSSSSEDSDDADKVNSVAENPVASLVALISDCRQNSSSSVETKNVPKAVSCLSKAQQEEYNSLMKILAEKKKMPLAHSTLPQKNTSIHSPLDDLKLLERKLVKLKSVLSKENESVISLSKKVNAQKFDYMKAKLSVQHLKEQLVAAEKVRKAKLLEWSNTCNQLKLMKQSVADLENKNNQIQNLCSRIGSSIQGQSYKLPTGCGKS